jgi:hypothetical protein
MRKLWVLAAVLVLAALAVPAVAQVTNVKSGWSSGNMYFYDKSGNAIFFIDGTNRVLNIPSGSGLTFAGLTATRVPFAGTAGALTDDADMTFATDTLYATKLNTGGAAGVADTILVSTAGLTFEGATGGADAFETVLYVDDPTADATFHLPALAASTYDLLSAAHATALTAGRVPVVSGAGILADDADFSFSTDTVLATKLLVGGVAGAANSIDVGTTAGRITWEGATGGADAFETTLGVTDPTADTAWSIPNLGGATYNVVGAAGALTSTRVPFADAQGGLADDSDLSFATDTLTATKLVASTSVVVGGVAEATNTLGLSGTQITFEGANVDDHETKLVATEPTADDLFSLPALTAGTYPLAFLGAGVTLTDTRIPYVMAQGALTDDSTFTYTSGTDTVTVDKLTVTTGPLTLPDGTIPRADLTEDALAIYPIPISDVRIETFQPLTYAEDAGSFYLDYTTNVLTLRGEITDNETETSVGTLQFRLPAEYVAAGDVTVRFRAELLVLGGAPTDNSSTFDLSCYEQASGAVGGDIVSTAAKNYAALSTFYNQDFSLTAASLVAGDLVNCTFTSAAIDSEAGGGSFIFVSDPPVFLADIKG